MAAEVAPARFGEYSIYQSVLEVALVVGTLGSTLLFSRNAARCRPP
jgi:O-antigen/teichoic acid export membrane protein